MFMAVADHFSNLVGRSRQKVVQNSTDEAATEINKVGIVQFSDKTHRTHLKNVLR